MNKFRKIIMLLIIIPFLIFLTSCDSFLNIDLTGHNDSEIIDFVNNVQTESVTKTIRVEAKYYKTNLSYMNDIPDATSIGSGAIYKKSGSRYYALTNNHVVSKKQHSKTSGIITFSYAKYTVYDAYNNSFSADVLYSAINYDLALLTFERSTKLENENKLGVFEISTSKLNTSSMLCAIGECLGQRNFIYVGYYQKMQKFSPNEETVEISNVTFDVIVHTAKIDSGSSGGALIDENFKLVGINFASASIESTDKYICTYAIPATRINEFLNDFEGVS